LPEQQHPPLAASAPLDGISFGPEGGAICSVMEKNLCPA
jgi:hypothetical protein